LPSRADTVFLLCAGPSGGTASLRPNTGGLRAHVRLQALNGRPDSDNCGFPARELLNCCDARQAVPDFHQRLAGHLSMSRPSSLALVNLSVIGWPLASVTEAKAVTLFSLSI